MIANRIRVVLADDHAVVRTGLRAVLGTASDIEVVAEATTGEEACALVATLVPDVVLMDLSMPGMGGAAATRAILEADATARVLVLTMHSEEEYLLPLLEAGAAGYLTKSAADTELVDAVRAVAKGEAYVSPAGSSVLIRGLRKKDPNQDERDRFSGLTQRERDVLRLVAHGYSAPEIGEQLFISPKTVDTYKARVSEKLGLLHRSDYVDFALRVGLMNEMRGPGHG
jgi:two-component system, NarL family, response regulator NreC